MFLLNINDLKMWKYVIIKEKSSSYLLYLKIKYNIILIKNVSKHKNIYQIIL